MTGPSEHRIPRGDPAPRPPPSTGARVRAPLPRARIVEMAPYAAPDDLEAVAAQAELRADAVIKLDANENPYGPSPLVAEALAGLATAHLYPDPEQKMVRRAIAAYVGTDPSRIIVGNGSDELLDLLCRVYLEPGDEVIDCTPTFGMYRFSTELCGGFIKEVPRRDDWALDVEAARAAITARTRLVFVATPNNPTGNAEPEEVARGLADTGCLVVLDQAYVEFGGPSLHHLAEEYDNVVVLRTFSKWAGLAGLRMGYGVFPGEVARHLWKVKPPFNINRAGESAVLATLEDLPTVRRAIDLILRERDRMATQLSAMEGLRVWPSVANFLLVQARGRAGADLKRFLASRGIAVRDYAHPRLADSIRLSAGRPEQTEVVVAAVRDWVATR